MNYRTIYISICKRGRDRKFIKTYHEKHHIFPRCLFKSKLIAHLTPKEHYIAHLLLYKDFQKRYGLTHYKTYKVGNAILRMMYGNKTQNRKFTARQYHHCKKINGDIQRHKIITNEAHPFRKAWRGEVKSMLGKNHTEDWKKENSLRMKGKYTGDKNPAKRPEVKQKISAARKLFSRDKQPRTKITEEQVVQIRERWEKEKLTTKPYTFSARICSEFHVKRNAIRVLLT